MATVTMTLEEYEAMAALIRNHVYRNPEMDANPQVSPPAEKKKRTTAYGRKYKKAFRKVAPKYKLKSGKWKKGGFRAAVRAAHKEARK